MNQKNGPRAGCQRTNNRMEVDEPAVRVLEGVGNQRHVLKSSQKIKKRITRLGHEDFVVRAAKQSENVGISLAGACGKNQGFWIDCGVIVVVVGTRHLFARRKKPLRRGAGECRRVRRVYETPEESCRSRTQNRTGWDLKL